MTIAIQSETPPLVPDENGAIRVGSSRVLLEIVIQSFQDGATPEAIVQRFPTLQLSDAYAAIAYYLRHPGEVETYLRQRESQAQEIQNHIQKNQRDLSDIRARINARRKS
jgi:uncharacterized protein (DUF433 family)